MDVQQVKSHIITHDKTKYILQELECHSIREYAKEFRCGIKGKTNTTSISVKKDTLAATIYLERETKGDLITVIGELLDLDFKDSFKWLCSTLGFKASFNNKPKENPLSFLKYKSKLIKRELQIYDESELDKYLRLPHYNLIKEGILPSTQEKFNICFDEEKNNILFPHRNIEGQLIGIKARVTDQLLELSGQKYFYELPYPKSLNVYGLYENKKLIKEKGYVIVVEGEKSVLKLWQNSIPSLSIGGHEISPEQRKLLLDLNVDIIIGYDEGVSLEHIKNQCFQFVNFRTTYYLYDNKMLLDGKDSPIDKGYKVFQELFNNKVLYKNGG